MDTKKLDALLLAVERGSLTAAAEEMGYTQSGLTNMMNSLENELGLDLLIRSKSGVRLTAAGEALLPHMRSLHAESQALLRAAEAFRQSSGDTLRLGAYSSVARQWLPAVLAEFRKEYPDTDVPMDVGGIPDIFEKLRSDSLDCAIVSYSELHCQGLHYIPLRDDPLVAVLPPAYRPEARAFPVSGFSGVEFLMPSAGFEADITPVFGQRVEKVGVSILSELVMRDMPYNVRTLPLDPPSSRRLGIAMAEQRSGERKIQRFVDCARRVIDQLYA